MGNIAKLIDRKIIHVLMSDYVTDSRVTNETVSLAKEGYEITVCCLKSHRIKTDEVRDGVCIKRFGLVSNKILCLITACFAMIVLTLRSKAHCIHAHDVAALPVAFLMSKLKRVPLIYDSHELWGESHHAFKSTSIVRIVVLIEKLLAGQAKAIITVSDSIKTHLSNHFNVDNVVVIKNIPSYTHQGDFDLFRETYGMHKDAKIFLHQGIIDFVRGVDLIVDAAINVCEKNKTCMFFFIGDGPDLDKLKLKVKKSFVSERIIFLGFVNQSELLKYTCSANVGIHAIKNSCLNHYYCLPNKLFEYIHSGLVLVVTDLVELGGFVKGRGVGLTFRDGDVKALEQALLTLIEDKVLFDRCKANSNLAAQEYTWDNEFIKLKEIYAKVC
jgi:glycosyltransferase involved in cell wall biosynthesis